MSSNFMSTKGVTPFLYESIENKTGSNGISNN